MRHHIPAEVLKTYESSSSDRVYEIRKSHQDGKVYCTCPGWIFQARKNGGLCKHLKMYMELLKAEDPVAVLNTYTAEEYNAVLAIHRSIPIVQSKGNDSGDTLKIQR